MFFDVECPMCGSDDWNIEDGLDSLIDFGTSTYTCRCNHCKKKFSVEIKATAEKVEPLE